MTDYYVTEIEEFEKCLTFTVRRRHNKNFVCYGLKERIPFDQEHGFKITLSGCDFRFNPKNLCKIVFNYFFPVICKNCFVIKFRVLRHNGTDDWYNIAPFTDVVRFVENTSREV